MRTNRMVPRIVFFVAVAAGLVAGPPTQASNPIQMTPQQEATWRQAGLLEAAGKSAAGAGDYADAATDLRRAVKLEPGIIWIWVELALALDYGGRQDEAFVAYQKGFGRPPGSTFGTNSPQMQEAVTRFGAMCEDRGLHEEAVDCFNAARRWEYTSSMDPLDKTLDVKTSSPTLVRMMLDIARGGALEDEYLFGKNRSADAMKAFKGACHLAPNDPRPLYFLAYGLRRARRFVEAEAVLQQVSHLDTGGRLRVATAKSLELVHEGWSGF